MMDALAVQEAVLDRLWSDDPLAAWVTGIYDSAPEDARLPYITLGQTSAFDWSTKTEAGARHRLDLMVFTGHRGQAEAKAIAGHLAHLLGPSAPAGPLIVNGQAAVTTRILAFDSRVEPVERLAQTLVRVEVVIAAPPSA